MEHIIILWLEKMASRINQHPPVAAKVGESMDHHMKSFQPRQLVPIPDQGLEFQDFGDDSSDSGLESIL